jgi:AraC family transcriptional regulator
MNSSDKSPDRIQFLDRKNGKRKGLIPGSRERLSDHRNWHGLSLEVWAADTYRFDNISLCQDLVLMSLEGKSAVTVQTGPVDFRDFYLKEDEILVIPSDWLILSLKIDISGRMMAVACEKFLLSCVGVELGRPEPKFTDFVSCEDPLVRVLALRLLGLEESSAEAYNQSLIHTLSSHLVHHYSSSHAAVPENNSSGLNNQALRKAIKYIHIHFAEDISTDMIAAEVNLNGAYFARMFKKSIGVSPHQYLLNCRINRAKVLLADKALRISEVAAMSGFYDQSHLTNSFKKFMKMTPSQYARSLRVDS